MNKMTAMTLGMVLVGSVAFAADTEHKVDSTSDTSKNPITGTETTSKEYKKDVKTASGGKGHMKVKEQTKKYKDGTVKTNTSTETETTEK